MVSDVTGIPLTGGPAAVARVVTSQPPRFPGCSSTAQGTKFSTTEPQNLKSRRPNPSPSLGAKYRTQRD